MALRCGCGALERIADGVSEVIGVTKGIDGVWGSVEHMDFGML